MTVHFYRNTDSSAPALTAAPGSLIALLDACLVNGYGSKAAAGWTKEYSGTNLAAYKQGAGSNGMYLRVDDTAAAASSRAARVTGFETMSAIGTGTNQFPTNTQVSGGLYWITQYPGTNGTATARNWALIADERFFYLILSSNPASSTSDGPTTFTYSEFYCFGDIEAYGTGDVFSTVLTGGTSSSDAVTTGTPGPAWQMIVPATGSSNSRIYVPRRFDGVGASTTGNFFGTDVGKLASTGSSYIGQGGISYPNGADGSLMMARVEVFDMVTSQTVVRGRLPGLWCPQHPSAAMPARYDTFDGDGDFTGKSFFVHRQSSAAAAIEISDTWR